jgi:hypothetical protein
MLVAPVLAVALGGGAGACAENEKLEPLQVKPGVVRVEAPGGKCWLAAIGSSTKEGCGSKSFDVDNQAIIVANGQKETRGRWKLTLVLEVDGEAVDEESTRAPFGVAQVRE